MTRHQRLLWAAVGLIAVVCLLWLVGAVALLWVVLSPQAWATIVAALDGRGGLVLFLWALALVPIHGALKLLIDRHLRAPAQLAEAVRLRMHAPEDQPITQAIEISSALGDHPETQQLVALFNQLFEQRRAQQDDHNARVAAMVERSERERARLSALMSELNRSVVVCNLDGQIVLYNNRARLQFKRLSSAGHVTDGGELLGIGRSIYAVLDRRQINHTLENVQRRLARGASAPTAQCVTATPAGKLFRIQISPVRVAGEPMSGFVLLIENITEEIGNSLAKEAVVNRLLAAARDHLNNLRRTADQLRDPALNSDAPQCVHSMLTEQIKGFSDELDATEQQSAQALLSRWPLEDMLAEDLLDTLQHKLTSELGLAVELSGEASALWFKVESYSLLLGVMALVSHLRDQIGLQSLTLRVSQADERGLLDLIWPQGNEANDQLDLAWTQRPLDGDPTLSLQTVLDRHHATLQRHTEQIDQQPHWVLRWPLPLANPQDELPIGLLQHHDARPEFYDFDLFQPSTQSQALHDRPLTNLTFTVFDTETTGLNPAQGDEIIQIGALRVVNGRILRQEHFDQLIDPGRRIPAASIPIHGITQAMVEGQPTIAEVLPAFHAFCADSVLVAHNAAFDMKCLAVKQAATGVRFEQPVLDTLLLSAVAHPNHPTHNLDDLAQRFGLTILGRHTAIGDAMVTAEILVRLIPLLADQGIVTLGQAMAASQRTLQARAKY